eukprot:TRINITY_DN840_c1_g4_i1.p1 TRINITY_DN840_c1_g4~~TRINITY_DN840_c1_g4_i1.p1  ORF type:complete len:523 (-),score=117.04 TRINITY_DN840_c1_g4_i1:69-1637(-)
MFEPGEDENNDNDHHHQNRDDDRDDDDDNDGMNDGDEEDEEEKEEEGHGDDGGGGRGHRVKKRRERGEALRVGFGECSTWFEKEFFIDRIMSHPPLSLTLRNGELREIRSEVYADGPTRVFRVLDDRHQIQHHHHHHRPDHQHPHHRHLLFEYLVQSQIKVNHINISLSNPQTNKSLMTIVLQNLHFHFELQPLHYKLLLQIFLLQIQNGVEGSKFPIFVRIRPNFFENRSDRLSLGSEMNPPLICLRISRSFQYNLQFFSEVFFEISQELEVNFDEESVYEWFEFFRTFIQQQPSSSSSSLSSTFSSPSDLVPDIHYSLSEDQRQLYVSVDLLSQDYYDNGASWRSRDEDNQRDRDRESEREREIERDNYHKFDQDLFYFDHFEVRETNLRLTFQPAFPSSSRRWKKNMLRTFLSKLGFALVSVRSAPLRLNGLCLSPILCLRPELKTTLKDHFLLQSVSSLSGVVGRLGFLRPRFWTDLGASLYSGGLSVVSQSVQDFIERSNNWKNSVYDLSQTILNND